MTPKIPPAQYVLQYTGAYSRRVRTLEKFALRDCGNWRQLQRLMAHALLWLLLLFQVLTYYFTYFTVINKSYSDQKRFFKYQHTGRQTTLIMITETKLVETKIEMYNKIFENSYFFLYSWGTCLAYIFHVVKYEHGSGLCSRWHT